MNNDKIMIAEVVGFVSKINEDRESCASFQLMCAQSLKQRTVCQVNGALEDLKSAFDQALTNIVNEMISMTPLEREGALTAFQQMTSLIESWKLEKGSINLSQLSDETCEVLYQIGRELIFKENYTEATKVFMILLILRPDVEQIWLGLAISQEYLGCLELAKLAYAEVLLRNPNHEYSKQAIKNM